jgi:hypothetical protein
MDRPASQHIFQCYMSSGAANSSGIIYNCLRLGNGGHQSQRKHCKRKDNQGSASPSLAIHSVNGTVQSGCLRGRSFQAMRWLAMIQREVTGSKLRPELGHSLCSFDLGVQAASGTTSCRNDPYPSHPKKPKEITSPEKQSTISRVAFGVTSNKQVRSEHHLDVGCRSISSALSSTEV